MVSIEVRVQPNSTQERADYAGGKLKVWLKAKPVEGEANKSLIKFLKKRFKALGEKPQINIIQGSKSQNKIVEINVTESQLKQAFKNHKSY